MQGVPCRAAERRLSITDTVTSTTSLLTCRDCEQLRLVSVGHCFCFRHCRHNDPAAAPERNHYLRQHHDVTCSGHRYGLVLPVVPRKLRRPVKCCRWRHGRGFHNASLDSYDYLFGQGRCSMRHREQRLSHSYHQPPAPTGLRATTQQATPQGGANTVVTLHWNSVPGASAYLVEWSASVNGSFAPINPSSATTVQLTATHVVAATTLPSAYVYHVRSVDSGGTASTNMSNIDYAVAGARLFASLNAQDEPIRKGFSPVRAMDIVELRRCIDALRSAAGVSQVWTGAPAPTGFITADAFLSLQSTLNSAMPAFGYGPFAYTGVPAPASCITGPCVPILSEHVQQLRDTLRNSLR